MTVSSCSGRPARTPRPLERRTAVKVMRLSIAVLASLLGVGLAACQNPNQHVVVGYPGYRTLPAGNQVSWPSSGTSNGAGCVPAAGKSTSC